LAEAKRLTGESLAICREIGYQSQVACRLFIVGDVINSLGEYQEAQPYGQEALAIARDMDYPYGIIGTFNNLGEAACGLRDFQAARQYLYEGLRAGMNARLFAWVSRVLVSWATLLTKEGTFPVEDSPAGREKKEQAVELLTLALHHPATWQIHKDKAVYLLAELEAELPPEVVAAAQERGKARQLEEVVAEILAETTTNFERSEFRETFD
ncbi:MAG: hypothetical protein L0Y56_18560, partial [Nitrospira sp.]|nr:hypothetical protein [Nitrospira sp.]